jgi:hypothetical protein
VTRILLADDQRDVLEALRILLKGEGYQTEAVTSLAGIFSALEKKDYTLLIMDLNYARDTTSGQEGLAAIPKIQEIDGTLPICCDDSVGVDRSRSRSNETWGTRFCNETVGQRAPVNNRAHTNRVGDGSPPGPQT